MSRLSSRGPGMTRFKASDHVCMFSDDTHAELMLHKHPGIRAWNVGSTKLLMAIPWPRCECRPVASWARHSRQTANLGSSAPGKDKWCLLVRWFWAGSRTEDELEKPGSVQQNSYLDVLPQRCRVSTRSSDA